VPPVETIRDQTTRHPGDAFSPGQGKRVEEIFGWIKTVGHLRRLVTEINSYQLSLDAFHKTINNNSKTIKMLTAPLITYLHTNNKLSYIYSWTTSKIDNSAYHPGDRFGRKQPELSRI